MRPALKSIYRFLLASLIVCQTSSFAGSATEPDLSVTISAHDNPVLVKNDIDYTITVTNQGSIEAIDSTVTTTVPSNRNFSFGGSGWSCSRSNDTVTCTYNGLLGAGASATLSLTRETESPDIDQTITQEITASASNGDYDTSNNSASVAVEVGQTNLQIQKTASKTQVNAEESFDYTLTASNPANGTTLTANDIVITDSIPTGFTITSLPTGCSNAGQDVTCTIASLGVGETQSFSIGVQAPSSTPSPNPATNTASLTRDSYVSGTNRTELPVSDSVDVEILTADLTLSLTANPSPVSVDSDITYTITASNIKSLDANGVEVTINLDNDLSYQSDDAGCSRNNQTLTCNLGTLNGNSNNIFHVTATAPSTHQTVTTTAHIETSTAESDTTNNNASLDTAIEGADLRITKSGPNSAPVETNIQYTITVYNDGIADAENVVVTDTLDTGMVYLNDSLTNNCQNIGNNGYECDLGTIAAGSSRSFTLDVTTPNKTGSTVNSVSVTTTTDQNNNTGTTATKTTTLITPDLNIAKSNTPTEVGLGGSFIYTLTVTNSQNAIAQDATITDTPPAGIKIDSISENNDGWSCNNIPMTGDGSTTFTCTLTSFPANGTSTIKLNATAPNSPGTYQNRARISHSLNSNDGEDTSNLTVTGVVLDVLKNAPSTAVAGGTIDYEITISNNSLTDAGTLTLTDTLPSGFTIQAITDADSWNCSGSATLTCTRNSLSAGGTSSTIKFRVNIPADTALGTVNNSANVHIDSPSSADFTSNSASTVIEGADIVVTKSGDSVAIANETVNVNITVTNLGNAVAKDVNVTIDLNTNGIANFTNIESDCGTGAFSTVTEPFICQLGDLAQNGSVTVRVRATAPNYDSNFPGHSDIANSASAVTSTSQSNTSNDSRTWNLEIRGADLIVDKVPSANEVAVGEKVTYTISLRNQGDAVATNIVLNDSVVETADGLTLSNLVYNSTDWSCTTNFPTGFECTYNSNLTSGQSTSVITVDATAPNSTTALDQQRSNSVEVSNNTAESDTATTNSKIAPVTIRGAALTIDKSVSPNPASLQQQVTFTIRVNNSGLADAANTEVTDTLPNGFSSISTNGCDNDSTSVSGQTVTCQLGTIAKTNGTKTFTITANAPNSNGAFTNTANVSTSTPEANTADNSDSAVLNVEGADLIPRKAAPARVAGNSEFEYTISLQNIGRSSAYGAEINDTIPTNNGTTYVEGSLTTINSNWTCTINNLAIHCTTNDPNMEIPSGYNENIATFRVKAGPAHYFINNTVVAGTDTSESNSANNTYTATTEVIDIDLLARKLVNGIDYGATENYTAIGETITYTLQISNVSLVNLDITDATVTDIIPNNVTNITVAPAANFTCNNPTNPGNTLTCTMNSGVVLAQGQTRNVATITVTVIDANHFDTNNENNNFVINRYKAETTLSDQDLSNNAPTTGDGYLHTNTLVRGANVSVDKTGPNQAGAEQNLTYTLHVRNWPRPDTYTGTPGAHDVPSTNAANVVVVDTLPSNVTFVSATGAGWSCTENSGKVTCTHSGDMSPSNTSSDIAITVTAPNATDITLTNEANVSTTTPELQRLLSDNHDTLATQIVGTDITVTKTGPATAGMGEELAYNIRVRNASNVPARDIHVDDILHTDVNLSTNWNRDLAGSGWSCVDNSSTAEHNVSCDYTGTLPANGSTQFTIYTIAPNYTGTIRNRAIATTKTAESNQPNISDFDTTIEGAEVGFANAPFTQSPNPVGAFMPIDYNITIINRGHSEAKDINFTMQFPAGFDTEFNVTSIDGDTGWNCNFNTTSHLVGCHLGTLAPNNTISQVRIHALAPNTNETVSYTLYVEGTDDSGQKTSETLTPAPSTTIKGSDLKIKKYVQDTTSPGYNDTNVTVGMTKYVEFNLSVENREIGLAKDLVLHDTFDNDFSDLSIVTHKGWDTCTITNHTLECRDATLSYENSADEVIVRAKTPSIEGTIDNHAEINGSTIETDTTNNQDDAYVKVEGSRFNVEVNVSKSPLAFDEIFDYNITIVNVGRNDAEDINVSDTLPQGFRYSGLDGSDVGWQCSTSDSNRSVLCHRDTLGAYNGRTWLTLNVIAPQKIGRYTNEINVSSPSIPAPVVASAPEVEVRGADINVSLSPSYATLLEEHNTTVAFDLKNIDLSEAEEVNATLTFSSTIKGTFLSVDKTTDCTVTATQIRCHWDALASDENRTVTVTLTTPAVDDDTNITIHLSSETVTEEPDTSNNEADGTMLVKAIKPIAEWRMDECSWQGSGSVKDHVGHHDGTAKKGAKTVHKILTIDDNGHTAFVRGGRFDGRNDYVKVPDSDDLSPHTGNNGEMTISVWIKAEKYPNSRKQGRFPIVAKGKDGQWEYGLYLTRWKTLEFNVWQRSGNDYADVEEGTLPLHEWHHLVGVLKKGAYIRLYLDGQKIGESTNFNGTTANGTSDLFFARRDGNNNFKGYMDEVKIFDMALDDISIRQIYEREKSYYNYDGTPRPTTMVCGTDASVSINGPSSVAVESEYDYSIRIKNKSYEPIEELNLTVELPPQVMFIEDSVSTRWNEGCSLENATHLYTCRFNDEGNLSNAWFKNEQEYVILRVAAPNEILQGSHRLRMRAEISTTPYDIKTSNNTKTKRTSTYGTDLSIEKSVDLTTPALNAPFVYTITVTNKSDVDAKDVEVTDAVPGQLGIASNSHTGWSYFNIDGHSLSAKLDLLPAHTSKYFTLTVSSPSSGTVTNTAEVTSYTAEAESDKDDNSASVSVNVGNVEGDSTIMLKDGFSLQKNETYYGDMVAIGNTYLTGDSNESTLLADINSSISSPSTAGLDLPYDTNITVTYARLYWTGHLHGEPRNANTTFENNDYQQITFHTPDGQTHTVTAEENYYYYNKTKYDTYRFIYACSANVTELLNDVYQSKATYDGTYGVSDLKTNTGIDDPIFMNITDGNTTKIQAITLGHFGGWNLVVFYKVNHRAHRDQRYKDISLFGGFKKLIPSSVGYDQLVIPIEGFLTPYGGETIDTRLLLFAGGGERARAVDYLSIFKTENNVSADVNISDGLNPENNVLNGTISQNGAYLTPRNPALEYSLGIDMDQFDISSNFTTGEIYLGHLQQETNVTLHVGREKVGNEEVFDQSFPSAIGLSTEINNPDFIDSYKECFVERDGRYIPCKDINITRGSELVYRITIVNTGNMEATDVVLKDPLPAEVSYSGGAKIVSITKPLCPTLDMSNEKIAACKEFLVQQGYFDNSNGLLDRAKQALIPNLGIDTDTNQLDSVKVHLETNPDALITEVNMTNEEMLDLNLTETEYPDNSIQRELLEFNLSNRLNYLYDYNGTFPALHVSWVEFRARVNTNAQLYQGFKNKAIIYFTNQTLAAAGRTENARQFQESSSAESPPVVFAWEALVGKVSDANRSTGTVGTKLTNKPFDLNISIDDSNSSLVGYLANYADVNVTLWGIMLVDRSKFTSNATCDTFAPSYSPVMISNFSRATTPPQFGLRSGFNEYLSFADLNNSGLAWITDANISSPFAVRDAAFCLQFKIRYKKGNGEVAEEVSPGFYGPFGDDFAIRPWSFKLSPSGATLTSTATTDYILAAGETFSLGIYADNGLTTNDTGYDTNLTLGTVSNDVNATFTTLRIYNNTDKHPCTLPVDTSELNVTLIPNDRLIFVDGNLTNTNTLRYDDVGYVTFNLRDSNWTLIDQNGIDCDSNVSNEGNNSGVLFNCAINGTVDMLFVPYEINVTTELLNRVGGRSTYMSNDIDRMSTIVNIDIDSFNKLGESTRLFDARCFADDVNVSIDANISYPAVETQPYRWRWHIVENGVESNVTINNPVISPMTFTVDDSNFTAGHADITGKMIIERNETSERNPLAIDISSARSSVTNYIQSGWNSGEFNTSSGTNTGYFWFARAHAPDYRSHERNVTTPLYVEVYCDSRRVDCERYGFDLSGANAFPESSDDVNWWINRFHDDTTGDYGIVTRLQARQGFVTPDPYISINGNGNIDSNLSLSFDNGVNTDVTIRYNGNDLLYRTKILMDVTSWLHYGKSPEERYNIEFNLPNDNWSGVGQLGEVIETNGSVKSNRRLEW